MAKPYNPKTDGRVKTHAHTIQTGLGHAIQQLDLELTGPPRWIQGQLTHMLCTHGTIVFRVHRPIPNFPCQLEISCWLVDAAPPGLN